MAIAERDPTASAPGNRETAEEQTHFDSRKRLRILTLSTLYPNPSEPSLGTFVRRRLQYVGLGADVKIIAPVAWLNYGLLGKQAGVFAHRPARKWRRDGQVEVLQPRWLYPPGGGVLNAVLLFLQVLPAVLRVRRHYRFDVIDSHFGHPDGIAAAMLALVVGTPFTITLRGNETMHAINFWRRHALRWALRRAARVITVSERLREFAISLGVSPDNAKTIPNGVDNAIFHSYDRGVIRQKHGIAPDTRIILSVGALIERKGHHRILRALRELAARGIDGHLWIVGAPGREGVFEPTLRALVAELGLEGRVRFCGQAPPETLAEWMSAADVLCLATEREGWPNVVHEALACGTPVVATDVGAIPALIPLKKYGFIVPLHDPDTLANALHNALSYRWDRDAIAAWGQSRGWEQVAAEVICEMRAITAPRGGSI